MREPENLKELIEYFEWNYERMEDDHDVICTFTDGDGFHDLLNDLKRKSAMCEANSNALLAEVRAEIYKLKFKSNIIEKSEKVGEGQLLINYNKGLKDALEIFNKKISEHFRGDPT